MGVFPSAEPRPAVAASDANDEAPQGPAQGPAQGPDPVVSRCELPHIQAKYFESSAEELARRSTICAEARALASGKVCPETVAEAFFRIILYTHPEGAQTEPAAPGSLATLARLVASLEALVARPSEKPLAARDDAAVRLLLDYFHMNRPSVEKLYAEHPLAPPRAPPSS